MVEAEGEEGMVEAVDFLVRVRKLWLTVDEAGGEVVVEVGEEVVV